MNTAATNTHQRSPNRRPVLIRVHHRAATTPPIYSARIHNTPRDRARSLVVDRQQMWTKLEGQCYAARFKAGGCTYHLLRTYHGPRFISFQLPVPRPPVRLYIFFITSELRTTNGLHFGSCVLALHLVMDFSYSPFAT